MAVPTNSSAPTITGDPRVNRTLTGAEGSWDGSPASYAQQWQRAEVIYDYLGQPMLSGASDDEVMTLEWEDVPGATALTYLVTGTQKQHMLRIRVIATNGDGDSEPAYSVQVGPILGSGPAGLLNGVLAGALIGALGFVDDDEGV